MRSGNRQLFVNQNDQPDEHHVAGVVEGDGVGDGVVVAGDDGVGDVVDDGVEDGVEVGVAGGKNLTKQPNLVRSRV